MRSGNGAASLGRGPALAKTLSAHTRPGAGDGSGGISLTSRAAGGTLFAHGAGLTAGVISLESNSRARQQWQLSSLRPNAGALGSWTVQHDCTGQQSDASIAPIATRQIRPCIAAAGASASAQSSAIVKIRNQLDANFTPLLSNMEGRLVNPGFGQR
jgi:hypothetical protein